MFFSVPLPRSAERELKYHGGEELQKRVIRKPGNGSSKALYLNKKVEVNPVPPLCESLGLLWELMGASPGHNWENLQWVTLSVPALCADAEAPRKVGVPRFAWYRIF